MEKTASVQVTSDTKLSIGNSADPSNGGQFLSDPRGPQIVMEETPQVEDLQILLTRAADFIVEKLPASEAPNYISLVRNLRSASSLL